MTMAFSSLAPQRNRIWQQIHCSQHRTYLRPNKAPATIDCLPFLQVFELSTNSSCGARGLQDEAIHEDCAGLHGYSRNVDSGSETATAPKRTTPKPIKTLCMHKPSHPRSTPATLCIASHVVRSCHLQRPDAASLGPQLQRFSYINGQSFTMTSPPCQPCCRLPSLHSTCFSHTLESVRTYASLLVGRCAVLESARGTSPRYDLRSGS